MAPLNIPPITPTIQPSPLSPTVGLNPPMVGSASPFLHVDGQNRDLILEAIRAWAANSLLPWTTAWQAALEAQLAGTDTWIDNAAAEINAYITANAVSGYSWRTTVTPIAGTGTTAVTIALLDAVHPIEVGDLITDTSATSNYGVVTALIDATHATVAYLGSLQGVPGPNTIPADTAIAGYITAGPSATKTALEQAFGVYAPPPTGVVATDTANLQAAITLAQNTYGTLYLQEGVYVVTNLATAQSFSQPKIVGKGPSYTTIQGTTTGSTLLIKGGSGGNSGGYISDITFTGTGVGLEIQGACFVGWDRLNFDGTQTTGILLHNYATGEFTEYCAGHADFGVSVVTALEYRVTSGSDSFHGSGLTGQSTINQPATATAPSILIGAGALPYNAPLDVTFWVRTATQALIRSSTALTPTFHGTIRVETFTTGALVADATGAAVGAYLITHVGSLVTFGAPSQAIESGVLALAERAAVTSGGLDAEYKSATEVVTVGPTAVALSSRMNRGAGSIMHVTLVGANYYYVYLLYVEQYPFDTTGTVVVLGNPYAGNTAGWGAPVFSVTGYKLTILNAAYPAGAVTATTTWAPLGNLNLL